jgi:hypothetical protein
MLGSFNMQGEETGASNIISTFVPILLLLCFPMFLV